MLNIKKTEILLIIFLLLFIFGFYTIQNPSTITKLFLIDSRATSQSLSLSVIISGCSEEDIYVTASGEANVTYPCNKPTIPKITGLPADSNIKVRVYTNATTPLGFTPPSTTIVTQIFNYINITLNTTLTGTATIYFNISLSNLGSTDPSDIRLYRYSTVWTELTTAVINGTSDPAEFNATTTSFSRFLIGKKGVVAPVEDIAQPAVGGKGSYGGPGTEPIRVPPPPIEKIPILPALPRIIKEEVKKIAEVTIEKPTGIDIWFYAILPLIVLGLALLVLFYFLIKPAIKYRKITFSMILLGFLIFFLVIPVTDEVLYWAIFPLSIIIILISLFYFLLWNRLVEKLHLTKTFNQITKSLNIPFISLKSKTYLIIFLVMFIIGLLYLTRLMVPTGYAILPSSKDISLLNSLIFIILFGIIGLFFYKKFKK